MSDKKNTIISVLALACALAALALSLLNTFRPGPDQSWENPALEEKVTRLQGQVDGLQSQVNSLETRLDAVAMGDGLANWSLDAAPWEDATGADVTLTALPATTEEGLSVQFSVRLQGREVANVPCQKTDSGFTATASLEAADGYSYYCIFLGTDGSRRQFALSTPENPVEDLPVYLESSLASYCNMMVDSWLDDGTAVTLTSAYIQVQLPRLSTEGKLTAEKAQLVLYCNSKEVSRTDIMLQPGEGEGSFELELSDQTIPLPEMGEDDYLDLWLEITLSDGRTLSTAGASWYNSPDGLFLVVG